MQLKIVNDGQCMIRAAIVGASGYSGAELMRLLSTRSDVRVESVTANSAAGQAVDAVYPALTGRVDGTFEEFDPDRGLQVDLAFVALPSGQGMSVVPRLLDAGARVIDLGGDFRLKSPELYERYYAHPHGAAGLLAESVYGLPEVNAEQIRSARLVANPGCYPTSAILGLLPALRQGMIRREGITITSMSGISGAGRSSSVEMSFSELNENIRAYKVGRHQHIPEIESVLSAASGSPVSVSFVPHLVPLTRGIYTTIHAGLTTSATSAEVMELYQAFYRTAPFVRIRREAPQIQWVARTNYCDIGLVVEERTGQLIILSVIDNLVKGAAGQAIQNMNLMFGLPEHSGLL